MDQVVDNGPSDHSDEGKLEEWVQCLRDVIAKLRVQIFNDLKAFDELIYLAKKKHSPKVDAKLFAVLEKLRKMVFEYLKKYYPLEEIEVKPRTTKTTQRPSMCPEETWIKVDEKIIANFPEDTIIEVVKPGYLQPTQKGKYTILLPIWVNASMGTGHNKRT